MLYVSRSGIEGKRLHKGTDSKVLTMGRHHCQWALDTFEARSGMNYHKGRWNLTNVKPFKGVILIGPPGHGKPMCKTTHIFMGDGSVKRLGDVVVGDMVVSHTGTPRAVTEIFEQGELPTLKITTASGRVVIPALDHPFLTPNGWVKAQDLSVGDILALRHNVSLPPQNGDETVACRMAGYFVGDGQTGYTTNMKGLAANISCAEPTVGEKIIECGTLMGFGVRAEKTLSKCLRYNFTANKNAPREWLRSVGLAGMGSYTKRVPDFVRRAGNDGVAHFIAAYFECDGSVNKKGKSRDDACVEFYSVNRDLLADIQHLLLRFGIGSNIREKNGKYLGQVHKSWRLSLSSFDAVSRFCKAIPLVGEKARRLKEWASKRTKFNEDYLADPIVSIEKHEPRDCRCLTVEVDHTFLANDIVVHNTEFATHYLALEINANPRTQSQYLHAIDEKAEEHMAFVARLFDPGDEAGRRNISIFPDNKKILKKKSNIFELKLPERLKSPTITAAGVMSARLGGDTNIQVWDDIVPASDVDEPTTRERRSHRLGATFTTRQRGENTFILCIGYFFHHDDALSKLWKTSKKDPGIFYLSKQYTGGPTSTPRFASLWPEVFPPHELAKRFALMNNDVSLWSANYEANPIADAARLIKTLRYYDPLSREHTDFLGSAQYHISIDPTATSQESSDKAGFVYAGVGEVKIQHVSDEGRQEETYQTRLRILDAQQIHANQPDLVEAVMLYAARRPVYQVHVECRSGFHATADIFQNRYGLEVNRLDPKNKNKEIRLKACAGVIDNSLNNHPAIVEFPGQRMPDGKVGPDPQWSHLYKQFLDFGYTNDDHMLDPIVQLVTHLVTTGELPAGIGEIQTVAKAAEPYGNPRIRAMIDEWLNPKPKEGPGTEEARWANRGYHE